jgi:hypothetical protein
VRGRVRLRTARVSQKVREQLSHRQVVKFFDKTGFMLGVLGLVSTEYVFLRLPQFFWLWFVATIPPLVALRWYLYFLDKHHFFLYDFCYFVQAGTLVTIFVFPTSRFAWQLHFVLAHGPLLWAIPTWRNSFVFHSLDKVTSVFIHSFPALLTYVHRWDLGVMCEAADADCRLGWDMITVYPVLYYLVWQALYILKTEVLCREALARDPALATSVRWLAADRRHPLNVVTTLTCRRLRILGPEEALDPETVKTKVVFWVVQLLYTVATFLPAKLAFDHQWACAAVMWALLCLCVWNGANYYIEVFSTRYTLKFRAPDSDVVDGAASVAPESPGLSGSENGFDVPAHDEDHPAGNPTIAPGIAAATPGASDPDPPGPTAPTPG